MLELNRWKRLGVLLALLGTALATSGYIGPGAGAGAIVVLVAVVLGVLLLFVGMVWYPMKRAIRSRRQSVPAEDDAGR